MSARAERRAMIALFAVFALLVQALAPVSAAAQAPLAGGVICTSHGAQPLPGDAGNEGASCQHCLCPGSAALPCPDPTAERLIPSALRQAPVWPLAAPPPPARDPPRPHGQGPPLPIA